MLRSEYRDGRRTWEVYRLKDKNRPDTSDNRETYGKPAERREAALALAQALNDGTVW